LAKQESKNPFGNLLKDIPRVSAKKVSFFAEAQKDKGGDGKSVEGSKGN